MENVGTKITASIIAVGILATGGYIAMKQSTPTGVKYEVQSGVGTGAASQSGKSITPLVSTGVVRANPKIAVAFLGNAAGKIEKRSGDTVNTLASGDSISAGDTVVTGSDGEAEIVFADSSVVRLAFNSVMSVKSADQNSTSLELASGEIWARILKPLTDDSFFTIDASDLSAGVRGTSLRMKRIGKKTDVDVIDSTSKSAETPGVDITYKDKDGAEKKQRILPEQSFVMEKDKTVVMKKLAISEAMKNEFIRKNTISDLVYMDQLKRIVQNRALSVERRDPRTDVLAQLDATRLAKLSDRIDQEMAATSPKREEVASYFKETSVRDRVLARMDSRSGAAPAWAMMSADSPASTGIAIVRGADMMDDMLMEAGREEKVIRGTEEIERIRSGAAKEAADPKKRQEIQKMIEDRKQELRTEIEGWKKGDVPATGPGNEKPPVAEAPPTNGLSDADSDKDKIPDRVDNCPKMANPVQLDTDKDGKGNACDDANVLPTTTAPVKPAPLPVEKPLPLPSAADSDGDAIADVEDNCPGKPNPGQRDADNDGKGDLCDTTPFLAPVSGDAIVK